MTRLVDNRGADQALQLRDLVAGLVRDVPDFPKPGVLFKDITPLLADAHGFAAVIGDIARRREGQVDVVAGIEARGFIIGAAVALELGLGFLPVRKAGKLPGATRQVEYTLEYGTATLEVHQDCLEPGQRVLVVDDVLATGGTAAATCELLELEGAQVGGVEMVMELSFLGGRTRLQGRDLHSTLVV